MAKEVTVRDGDDDPEEEEKEHDNHVSQVVNRNDDDNIDEETDDDDDDRRHGDASAEAAGVVRGVSRSILRSPIGRLPRHRVPIRQVARVSDRVATGWDWYTSAVESSSSSSSTGSSSSATQSTKDGTLTTATRKLPQRHETWQRIKFVWRDNYWPQVKNFTGSIVKNTFLGLVVFETYGYVISALVPDNCSVGSQSSPSQPQDNNNHNNNTTSTTTISLPSILSPPDLTSIIVDRTLIDEEGDNNQVIQDELDDYARASLSVHFSAGMAAGSVHGIAMSILESSPLLLSSWKNYNHLTTKTTTPTRTIPSRLPTTYMVLSRFLHVTTAQTLYHGISHSLLFGSYEGIKRLLIHHLYSVDHSTEYYGAGYLAAFTLAGGMAGQIQHVASHYGEQYLTMRGLEHGNIVASTSSSSFSSVFRSMIRPTWRQTVWAFPPSAIGFVAFEYGKKFAT